MSSQFYFSFIDLKLKKKLRISLFNQGSEYDKNVVMLISGRMFYVVIIPTYKVLFLPDSFVSSFLMSGFWIT